MAGTFPPFYVHIPKSEKEAHEMGIRILSEIAQSVVRIVTGEGVMLVIPRWLMACKKFTLAHIVPIKHDV